MPRVPKQGSPVANLPAVDLSRARVGSGAGDHLVPVEPAEGRPRGWICVCPCPRQVYGSGAVFPSRCTSRFRIVSNAAGSR